MAQQGTQPLGFFLELAIQGWSLPPRNHDVWGHCATYGVFLSHGGTPWLILTYHPFLDGIFPDTKPSIFRGIPIYLCNIFGTIKWRSFIWPGMGLVHHGCVFCSFTDRKRYVNAFPEGQGWATSTLSMKKWAFLQGKSPFVPGFLSFVPWEHRDIELPRCFAGIKGWVVAMGYDRNWDPDTGKQCMR